MKSKVFFIMILILLAAQFGAAQGAFVVYEGAESTHNVDLHSGNEYLWEVYKDLNPDIPAEPTEFYFVGPDNTNSVTVHWVRAGFYYLKVTETDPDGCTNVKALAVSVVSNSRTIGFSRLNSNDCFSTIDNGFNVEVEAIDNGGNPLESSFYPLQVSFTVNGTTYSQSLAYNNQFIQITENMFADTPDADVTVTVEITEAADNQNGGIQPSNRAVHKRIIFAVPKIQFTNSTSGIVQGTTFTHSVVLTTGNANNAEYTWSVQPANSTSSDLSLITGSTADITWDGPIGNYTLTVSVRDGNGCVGDPISQQIKIVEPDALIISAGPDTIIGSCNPYQLQAWVSDTKGLSYSWQSSDNLDDPTILNPVFTPGNTTTFILTVTTSEGVNVMDTVTIDVAEIYADAGEDRIIEEDETVQLDGSASVGEQIEHLWSTVDGTIISGENTATPTVIGAGTYYLDIVDSYACIDTDSVVVIETEKPLLIFAGNDTIIASCNAFELQAWVSDTTGLSYLWEPADNLDDATLLNPVFTPENTTTFILTVTTSEGMNVMDTVEVLVEEIGADAGGDIYMTEGSLTLLDGLGSFGVNISYSWTTDDGKIESGADTESPVVSGFGVYYLEVLDLFGCIDIDSVIVEEYVDPGIPIEPEHIFNALDDYDTTKYQTEVIIDVLDNDTCSQDDIDKSSLTISKTPFSGTAYVDYEKYTVHYRPNNGFSGSDYFEYQICDSIQNCRKAYVFVEVLGMTLKIPNAFTPNGDNINDYFEIKGIEFYSGNSLSVVNRWGKVVYEARNYGIDTEPKFWDGTWQKGGDGKGLPTGTYFYVLDLGNGEKPIAGSVYIDR